MMTKLCIGNDEMFIIVVIIIIIIIIIISHSSYNNKNCKCSQDDCLCANSPTPTGALAYVGKFDQRHRRVRCS